MQNKVVGRGMPKNKQVIVDTVNRLLSKFYINYMLTAGAEQDTPSPLSNKKKTFASADGGPPLECQSL